MGRILLMPVWALLLASGTGAIDDADQVVATARAHLERKDAAAAVRVLESLLADSSSIPGNSTIQTLAEAYHLGIKQAEAAGQRALADEYRVALQIIERKSKSSPPPNPAQPDGKTEEAEKAPRETIQPKAESTQSARGNPGTGPDLFPIEPPATESPKKPSPKAETATTPDPQNEALAEADRQFRARQYEQAGKLYSELAKASNLPKSRLDAWAYCRRFAVVQRINSGPKDYEQWQAIRSEIEAIQRMGPRHWYDEYLRSLVVELSAASKPDPKRPVLRGASPDEKKGPKPQSQVPHQGYDTQTHAPRAPAPQGHRDTSFEGVPKESKGLEVTDLPHPREADPKLVAFAFETDLPTSSGNNSTKGWKKHATGNFLIFHDDQSLAIRVGAAAERIRREQMGRWADLPTGRDWDPPCHLYLYPSATAFASATGQRPESPGFSTTGYLDSRVTSRRINLRADHPRMVEAVLPHEVTHVVLAGLRGTSTLPRWADEGIAILAEPEVDQNLRLRELFDQYNSRQLPTSAELMRTEVPIASEESLFHAQSFAITRFLVQRSSPVRFLAFLRDVHTIDPDKALYDYFQLQNTRVLDQQWVAAEFAPARQVANGLKSGETR